MLDPISIIAFVGIALVLGVGGYCLGRWIGARMTFAGKPLVDRRAKPE